MANKKSKTIFEKLTFKLDENIAENVDPNSQFKTKKEFNQCLTEGTLLNVGKIGARALSIPCGEYVVWANDPGHTMLVPLDATKPNKEVYSEMEHYDVLTLDLLNNWDKVSRTLAEYTQILEDDDDDDDASDTSAAAADDERDEEGQYQSRIDKKSVDRHALARAIEASGKTEQEIADAAGVDKSTVSRWLRVPKGGANKDPGGRNPGVANLGKILKVLPGLDAKQAIPDVLGGLARSTSKSKKTKTRGSGQKNRAKGDTRRAEGGWNKGNTNGANNA